MDFVLEVIVVGIICIVLGMILLLLPVFFYDDNVDINEVGDDLYNKNHNKNHNKN